ncbi:MAG: hypothetical protein K5985_08645 [Lachnospiraceae bacterium]|nr:hypothetical protein [Lachnospiraceae bacterium]
MDSSEVVLYRTVNMKEKERIISLLVNSHCSYLEKWEKIPLLKRREYDGAKEICVIYVNENQYELASEVLDTYLGYE